MKKRYTDFGFSSEIDKAFQSVIPPNTFEPILHYISPEQTGRMNRDIDYRTDYYSLGVVFYEILSGKVPFTTEDRLDIIYNHIAMAPVNLDSVNPRVCFFIYYFFFGVFFGFFIFSLYLHFLCFIIDFFKFLYFLFFWIFLC